MENLEETIRLEAKTDPEAVRKQGIWCGLRPGLRVLDAGCGSGKVTSILHELIKPDGEIMGIDSSKERINYAKQHYGAGADIGFRVHDVIDPLDGLGTFDLIWVRFLLEYYRVEGPEIVKNLDAILNPGGLLCLLDLDHNCLNHYELPKKLENILFKVVARLEQEYNFDPYSGRKLYAFLYDLGYQSIHLELTAHHLIYGDIKGHDIFNWMKKVQVAAEKAAELFERYPGGHDAFLTDFSEFFLDPRRFTYTPLIMCKGMKPKTRSSLEGKSLDF
jgi:ubiquinone/menaquinone biosynthesis C-methylase UbiE